MRLHVIKHVVLEGPGAIAGWARSRGHSLAVTELERDEPLPVLGQFDALVLMGGPMSVNDEDRLAWLRPEKALLRDCLAAGKKVFGICLGAQMIASALGARVAPMGHREIGWFPVRTRPEGAGHPFLAAWPERQTVFHWHGEQFELPPGAQALWWSEACPAQAFALGTQAFAVQCHPEATEQSIRDMVALGRSELAEGGTWVQDERQILAGLGRLTELHDPLHRLLDAWQAA